MNATLTFHPDGTATGLWNDLLPALGLGRMKMRRASTIRWNNRRQEWEVRRSGGTRVLFRHGLRGECITWEQENLQ